MATIRQRFSALIRRIQPRPYTGAGAMIPSNAGAIHDGLTYEQPVIVTNAMRQSMTEAQLQKHIAEASRDTFGFQFDTRSAADMPINPTTEDPLTEWDWSTRVAVLTQTHSVYARNPIAKRAVDYVAAFVVGSGFNLTCKNKDVETILQAFLDNPDNDVRGYEAQAVKDLLVDGELFIRAFAEDGQTVIVPLRPWEVQYIRTEQGFFRRVKEYHMQPYSTHNSADPEARQDYEPYNVPGADMIHIAINRHGYELRGRPDLYPILPWLRAYKEWLENRARQNFWRGALLWLVQVAGGTPAAIAAVLARWSRPPTPGSVAVESDKVTVSPLSNPVGAGDAGEDGRQIKIMAAVGMGLPEYMLGDGQNANLASSKSQQLPALTTFASYQRLMIEKVWYPVLTRVLQTAIDNGDLPEEVDEQDADGDDVFEEPKADETAAPVPVPPVNGNGATPTPALPVETPQKKKRIATLDAFDISYEPLGDNEPFTLAQALQIAVQNNWASNETASTEMGFDYPIEKKKMKREKQDHNRAVMSGEEPMPPGMIPPGYDGANEDEQQPEMVR